MLKVVCHEHGMKLVHLSTAVSEIQSSKYWMRVPCNHRLKVIQVSLEAMAAMHTIGRESVLTVQDEKMHLPCVFSNCYTASPLVFLASPGFT